MGDQVIEAVNVSKGFDGQFLMENMNFSLPPGGIIGIIGANGAGKSTLFQMIIGHETPDNGAIHLGDTIKMVYVDQSRTLDADKTIWEEITGGNDQIQLGTRLVNSRAYVGVISGRWPVIHLLQEFIPRSLFGGILPAFFDGSTRGNRQ